MNQKQTEFLEMFMDDYQKNKFHYLVKKKKINSVLDIYDTKEDYKNIESTKEENIDIVKLMNAFNGINQKKIVKNIEDNLLKKKELTEKLDTFVEENISALKKEYKDKMSKVKNIFINTEIINIRDKVINEEEEINKTVKIRDSIIKVGYLIVVLMAVWKVF